MLYRFFINWSCVFGFLFASQITLASTFNITPLSNTVLPSSILYGQTTTAYYLVRNNSSTPQRNNYVRHLPPNVTQVVEETIFSNSCGLNFDLAEKGPDKIECILQLTISGAVDSEDKDPTHHLEVCSSDNNCSGVDDKINELNVTEGKVNELTRVAIVNESIGEPESSNKFPFAYVSTDAGVSWARNKINGAIPSIRAITCKGENGQSCVAIGEIYGTPDMNSTTFMAYNSKDGGTSWSSHLLGAFFAGGSGLNAVTCNEEHCVVVGSYHAGFKPPFKSGQSPIVYNSLDGGNSWAPNYQTPIGTLGSALRAISCKGQYCTAVGEFDSGYENYNNTITFLSYTSTDGGFNWTPHIMEKHSSSPSLLTSITCNGDHGQNCVTVGYSAGHDKMVMQPISYRSTNGGIDWTSGSIPYQEKTGYLNAITCSGNNSQTCIAVGSSNQHPTVYKSIDGGASWLTQNLNIANYFIKDHILPQGGTLNSVVCTNNGKYCTIVGSCWNYIPSGLNGKLIPAYFPVIFNSIDGGNNWYRRRSGFVKENAVIRSINSQGISVAGQIE